MTILNIGDQGRKIIINEGEMIDEKLNVYPLIKSLYVAAVIQRQMIGYNSARCNHIDSMCHTIRVKQ